MILQQHRIRVSVVDQDENDNNNNNNNVRMSEQKSSRHYSQCIIISKMFGIFLLLFPILSVSTAFTLYTTTTTILKTGIRRNHINNNNNILLHNYFIPQTSQQQQQQQKLHRIYSSNTDSNDSSSSSSSTSTGLVRQTTSDNNSILKTQLLNAFTNLGTNDQYDAVLTGLCAKILDDTSNTMSEQDIVQQIQQNCCSLLQEMNQSKITASTRSIMALIDATTKTQNVNVMDNVIRLCIRNNSQNINQYGQQIRDIRILPNNIDQTRIVCPDGSRKTVLERFNTIDDIDTLPIYTDDRSIEVLSASIFIASLVTCELINLSSSSDSIEHIITSLLLTGIITITVIDNAYDVLKTTIQLLVSQIKAIENKDQYQLPNKNTLPFNIGQGILTGTVVRGLTRFITIDTVRESQCEAAALYVAYVLGLPCFPYRPNAYEASVLVAESTTITTTKNSANSSDRIDDLLTSSGIVRILIWLYAPVIIEYMNHPQLVCSDPREAKGFLQRLEDYYTNDNNNSNDRSKLFWLPENNPTTSKNGSNSNNMITDDILLKWAYLEAEVLIRNNKPIILELSNRLASGAATIGDCVAVIENWE